MAGTTKPKTIRGMMKTQVGIIITGILMMYMLMIMKIGMEVGIVEVVNQTNNPIIVAGIILMTIILVGKTRISKIRIKMDMVTDNIMAIIIMAIRQPCQMQNFKHC